MIFIIIVSAPSSDVRIFISCAAVHVVHELFREDDVREERKQRRDGVHARERSPVVEPKANVKMTIILLLWRRVGGRVDWTPKHRLKWHLPPTRDSMLGFESPTQMSSCLVYDLIVGKRRRCSRNVWSHCTKTSKLRYHIHFMSIHQREEKNFEENEENAYTSLDKLEFSICALLSISRPPLANKPNVLLANTRSDSASASGTSLTNVGESSGNLQNVCWVLTTFVCSPKVCSEMFEFGVLQKCANLVDHEKWCKMNIWLQNSVLI